MTAPKWWTVDAMHPSGRGAWTIKFFHSTIRELEKEGPGHDFYSVKSAVETLQTPTATFEGLNRPGHSSSYCYAGRPRRYTNTGAETPPIPGRVFLVFVTDTGVFLKGRWEEADPEDRDRPLDWSERFGKPLWKKS